MCGLAGSGSLQCSSIQPVRVHSRYFPHWLRARSLVTKRVFGGWGYSGWDVQKFARARVELRGDVWYGPVGTMCSACLDKASINWCARERWLDSKRTWARRRLLLIAGEGSSGSRKEVMSLERACFVNGPELSLSMYEMDILRFRRT